MTCSPFFWRANIDNHGWEPAGDLGGQPSSPHHAFVIRAGGVPRTVHNFGHKFRIKLYISVSLLSAVLRLLLHAEDFDGGFTKGFFKSISNHDGLSVPQGGATGKPSRVSKGVSSGCLG